MLIGFHGKMKRGKDTSFQILRDAMGDYVRRESFADRLKLSAARALGYREGGVPEAVEFCNRFKDPDVAIAVFRWQDDDPIHTLSGREYLQYYGTEAHRDVFDPNFWINAALSTYDPNVDEIVAITDVRFPNEAEAIRAAGGVVVQIIRPDLDADDNSLQAHVSEQPLAPELVDFVIINDGTLEGLRDKVLDMVSNLPSYLAQRMQTVDA